MTIVEQIHQEFLTAQDKLLMEKPNACAETLYNLGFVKSRTASEYDPRSQETKHWAEYFRFNYPQYRFISESQVTGICRRYNLLCTTVDRYLGDVPVSKIAEISSFSIKQEDIRMRFIGDYGDIDRVPVHQYYSTPKETKVGASNLWICCPESDIDMEGLTRAGTSVGIKVQDPVVLQPVEGGFLIVAAWGPEASDEDVVNHKMN